MKRAAALALLAALCLLLPGCGEKKEEPTGSPTPADQTAAVTDDVSTGTPLTQREVDLVNQAFAPLARDEAGNTAPTEISCFFTSQYASPQQIVLEDFLCYCPRHTDLTDEDAEEFRAVLAAMDTSAKDNAQKPSEYHVPVHRYRRSDIDDLLTHYAGITADELDSWDNVIYLEEYDAFYNFTSDFGPGIFPCAGGEKDGDTVRLWTKEKGAVLTLQRSGETYLITSLLSP